MKNLLRRSGFTDRSAKGSHTRWYHPLLPDEPLTLSGKDGDDAKPYQEKEVDRRLKKIENLNRGDDQT